MDKETLQIRYAHFCHNSTLLGPGNRFVLWVQGCMKACPGCVAKSMQPLTGGHCTGIAELAEEILSVDGLDGVTVSGGEPFLQAEALHILLDIVKKIRPEWDVILYTGYQYEELLESENEAVKKLLSLADVLIDGEYKEELNDDVPYRGSSNQRIICLGNKKNYGEYYSGTVRESLIELHGNMLYLVGVPSKRTLRLWQRLTGGKHE